MEAGSATTSLTPADEAKLYAARNLSSRQIMSDDQSQVDITTLVLFQARMFTVQSRNLQDKVSDNRHKKVTIYINYFNNGNFFYHI